MTTAVAPPIPAQFERDAVLLDFDSPRLPRGDREMIRPWPVQGLDQLAQSEEQRWNEILRGLREQHELTAAVGASGWVAICDSQAPAAAGTARTMLNVISAANRSVKLTELGVGFIGASGTAKPVLIELCTSTQAGAGTGSTGVTLAPTDPGDASTVQATAAKNYATTEPTTLTAIRRWHVHPQAGIVVQFPLGREPRSGIAKGLALRITFESAETTTNVSAYEEVEE